MVVIFDGARAVIIDSRTGEEIPDTIRVNHPVEAGDSLYAILRDQFGPNRVNQIFQGVPSYLRDTFEIHPGQIVSFEWNRKFDNFSVVPFVTPANVADPTKCAATTLDFRSQLLHSSFPSGRFPTDTAECQPANK